MDSLIYGFAGMLVGFLAIYLFLAKKVDRTEYTNELNKPQSKIASKRYHTQKSLELETLGRNRRLFISSKVLEKKDQKEGPF